MPTYRGADGALLHYDVLGAHAGPPLIALAGGAAQHPDYLGDLAGLSREHRLVVPHLRGVGRSRSAGLGERGSRWRQADDLDLLRAELQLERCVLLGHSAGTRLAVAYAAKFPQRLAGLVLIGPPAAYLVDDPPDTASLVAARMHEPAFTAAVQAYAAGPDPSSDDTFTVWQHAIAPLGYAQWDATAQQHAHGGRHFLAANRAFMSGEGPADLLDRLRAVHTPTLVIAGAKDASAGVRPVVAVADLFPNGRAAVIPDCGHFPWVEQPDAFRAVVDPFLAELHEPLKPP